MKEVILSQSYPALMKLTIFWAFLIVLPTCLETAPSLDTPLALDLDQDIENASKLVSRLLTEIKAIDEKNEEIRDGSSNPSFGGSMAITSNTIGEYKLLNLLKKVGGQYMELLKRKEMLAEYHDYHDIQEGI